jgi:hypothetical protein
MPPTLFKHLRWLRIFFYAPSVAWALLIVVFFLLALAPSVGCDPSQGYCKGYILAS